MKIMFIILVIFGLNIKADQKVEESIKKQLNEFHGKIVSEDEEVRKKALKDILPDENTFKQFLTDEEVQLAQEPMKMFVEQMIKNNVKFKEEFLRKGKILSIELTSLKEKHPNSKFLKRIKFPVYSAFTKTANGGGGSSSYFLVDGKLKWIRGLESFDRALEHFKKMK